MGEVKLHTRLTFCCLGQAMEFCSGDFTIRILRPEREWFEKSTGVVFLPRESGGFHSAVIEVANTLLIFLSITRFDKAVVGL